MTNAFSSRVCPTRVVEFAYAFVATTSSDIPRYGKEWAPRLYR